MGVQICDKARSKGKIVKYNVAQGHGSLTTTDGTLCVFRDTEVRTIVLKLYFFGCFFDEEIKSFKLILHIYIANFLK